MWYSPGLPWVVVAVVVQGIPNKDLGFIDPLTYYISVGDANR